MHLPKPTLSAQDCGVLLSQGLGWGWTEDVRTTVIKVQGEPTDTSTQRPTVGEAKQQGQEDQRAWEDELSVPSLPQTEHGSVSFLFLLKPLDPNSTGTWALGFCMVTGDCHGEGETVPSCQYF